MSTILLTLGALGLVIGGYWLARFRLRSEWTRLRALRQIVAGEFVTLQQVQRINDIYFHTRDELRRSAGGGQNGDRP